MSTERHLLVRAGDELCLLPLSRVRRVVRDLPVTPLPGSSPELKGLTELGGEPLPVLDLARLVGAAPGANPLYPLVVVAAAGADGAEELVGLSVDAALEVVDVPSDAVVHGREGVASGDVSVGGRPARVVSLVALGRAS